MKKTASRFPIRMLLVALAMGAYGAALGYFGAKSALVLPGLRERLDTLQSWDLLALPVIMLLVLAVHELGHLGAGIRRGMCFLLLIVGPFQFTRTTTGIRFNWVFNLGTLGGVAAAFPDPDRPMLPQMRALVLGGPLASVGLAVIAVIASAFLDGRPAAYAFLIAAFSTAIAVVTAIPMRAGGFMSDGKQFLELQRGSESAQARLMLVSVLGQSMAGTRPRELDAEILGRTMAMSTGEPGNFVTAHYFGLLQAIDRNDATGARRSAQVLEEHCDQYPDGFRQSLAIEIAIHHALCRRDAIAAAHWLGRAKGGVVDRARRVLAEAALAVLQGRGETADKLLAQADAALTYCSDAGIQMLTVDQIAALKSRASLPALRVLSQAA